MREILFRGKTLGTGEWIYGDVGFSGGTMIWVHNERGNWNYMVDPATIGQYTGLTDKNGKRIFEGDIVRFGDSIHLVVFEKRAGNAYFGIVMDEQETWGFCPSVPSNKMEVIGNIHDKPELLEGD